MTSWEKTAAELSPAKVESLTRLLEASGGDTSGSLSVLKMVESLPGDPGENLSRFLLLTQLTESWAQAKLALSLLCHSRFPPAPRDDLLLTHLFRANECVPAAIRLWETVAEHEQADPERQRVAVETAVSIGLNGRHQVELAKLLLSGDISQAELENCRQIGFLLNRPGLIPEGAWGLVKGHWSDNAVPQRRQQFGMSLTSEKIRLEGLRGCKLVFEAQLDVRGLTDRCHLEARPHPKARWRKLLTLEGSQPWQSYEVDLGAYDNGNPELRFHVLTGPHREGEGVQLRNLRVVGYRPDVSQPLHWSRREGFEATTLDHGERQGLMAREPEAQLELAFDLGDWKQAHLCFSAQLLATSVYQKATLNLNGEKLLEIQPGKKRESYSIPLPSRGLFAVEVRQRPQRDEDGFYLCDLRLVGNSSGEQREISLDGSPEDGPQSKRYVLEMLRRGDFEALGSLVHLAQRLGSVNAARHLLPHLEGPDDVEALVRLYQHFGEQAPELYQSLESETHLEDLVSLLIQTGPDRFESIRDLVGEGVLLPDQVKANIELYLRLAEGWQTEQLEKVFTRILTPVNNETLAERREAFARLADLLEEPGQVLKTWTLLGRWCGDTELGVFLGFFLHNFEQHGLEEAWERLPRLLDADASIS